MGVQQSLCIYGPPDGALGHAYPEFQISPWVHDMAMVDFGHSMEPWTLTERQRAFILFLHFSGYAGFNTQTNFFFSLDLLLNAPLPSPSSSPFLANLLPLDIQ